VPSGRGLRGRRPFSRDFSRPFLLPLAAVFAALVLAAALVAPAGHAAAASTGTIEGQLVGKNGATKLGGTPVVLEVASSNSTGAPDEHNTTAGADGKFRFDNVPLDQGDVYVVKATYDSGNYFTEVTFDNGATTAQASLTVYPSTRDAGAVSFARFNTIISSVDQTGMQVVETGAYHNGTDHAYIGPGGSGDATTLHFALPDGAGGVNLVQGINRDTAVQTTDGFASLDAVPPGDTQFAYTYGLVPSGKTFSFNRVFPYRTDAYQLFVPKGITVSAAGGTLQDGGVQQLPNGQQYHLYTAANIAPNTRLTIQFGNLPTPGGEINPLLPALAVFVLVLGIGLIVAYGRQRKPASAPAAPGAARTVRTVPAGAAVARPARAATPRDDLPTEELEARRRRLLLELVDLDERHEAGDLAEPEYRRERAARKAELVGVLRELEAGARQPT
jgi:hypothetical protein